MDLSLRIVLAQDFLRADASGKADLASVRRLAQQLADADASSGHLPILLDVRQVEGMLSILDLADLVKAMLNDRLKYQTRLALLVRPDSQFERARFMEDYARNRSIPIGAFTDLDAAVRWLGAASAKP
jgi:hypothetical protein